MIAPQPFFEPRGTPFSVLGRLLALSRLGHGVDLLTYHVGQNVTIPRVRIFRTTSINFISEIPIGPSWMKFLLDILLFVRAVRLLIHKRYDLLYTHEEASFFGLMLSRIFKIPHIYDMHSSLPEQLGNYRFYDSRLLIRLFQWLEYKVISSCDVVITICPALASYVTKINGHVPQVMIENVPIPDNFDEFSSQSFNTFDVPKHLLGKKIVLYAGTFEPYQGISLLVRTAQRVLIERSDTVFLLAGGKPNQIRKFQKRVEELGLSKNFYFAGIRSHEEIRIFERLSHLFISTRTGGTNTPSKIYHWLQTGKPIVATNLLVHTQVLNKDVALLVEPQAEALAQGVLSILENPQLGKKLGIQARQIFEKKYRFDISQQKMERVLKMSFE